MFLAVASSTKPVVGMRKASWKRRIAAVVVSPKKAALRSSFEIEKFNAERACCKFATASPRSDGRIGEVIVFIFAF